MYPSKMILSLLSLPVELFREILVQAVIARGLKRALRLKLVCKLFAAEVPEAIIQSGVLQLHCISYSNKSDLNARYLRYVAVKHQYQKRYFKLNVIATIADRLCMENKVSSAEWKDTRRQYIENLCDLAISKDMDLKMPYPFNRQRTRCISWFLCNQKFDDIKTLSEMKKSFLVAAASTNSVVMIRQLVPEMLNPTWFKGENLKLYSRLLGGPFEAAAERGHIEALKALFESIPESVTEHRRLQMKKDATTAALLGRQTKTVCWLLSDVWTGWSHTRLWSISRPLPRMIFGAPEVYSGIMKMAEEIADFDLDMHPGTDSQTIQYHAIHGEVEMFDHTLKRWKCQAPRVIGGGPWNHEVVMEVCARGHLAILERLLKKAENFEVRTERAMVSQAAAMGHFNLVRLLVSKGYDINDDSAREFAPPVLVSAIELEHTEMYHYFRKKRANFCTPETIETAIGRAKKAGLESMLKVIAEDDGLTTDMLFEKRIDLDSFPPIPMRELKICRFCREFVNSEMD